MAMHEVAKSEQREVNLNKPLDQLPKSEVAKLADGILSKQSNVDQVKKFPDVLKSLDSDQQADFAIKLTEEIQNSIKELRDLGIEKEYTPEITKEAEQQLKDLNFVLANQDKIPQSYSKLKTKANEVVQEMGKEITDKGILDNQK